MQTVYIELGEGLSVLINGKAKGHIIFKEMDMRTNTGIFYIIKSKGIEIEKGICLGNEKLNENKGDLK